MPTNTNLVPVGNPPTNIEPVFDVDTGAVKQSWSKFFSSLARFAQMLQISTGLPVYANNAAALAGGLVKGQFYRTAGDPALLAVVV